jgi:hypothetical protein
MHDTVCFLSRSDNHGPDTHAGMRKGSSEVTAQTIAVICEVLPGVHSDPGRGIGRAQATSRLAQAQNYPGDGNRRARAGDLHGRTLSGGWRKMFKHGRRSAALSLPAALVPFAVAVILLFSAHMAFSAGPAITSLPPKS